LGAGLSLKPKLRDDFANASRVVENRPHFNETMQIQIQRTWIAPHQRAPGEFDGMPLHNALERGGSEV
jgi:hypothetical protein